MKKIIIFTTLLIGLSSCTKNKAEPVPVVPANCPDTILFSTQIMSAIFESSCNGCHSSGGSASGSGVFTNHTNIASDAGVILKVLNHDNGVSAMPIGGDKLNDSLITAFECWINQGKLNN